MLDCKTNAGVKLISTIYIHTLLDVIVFPLRLAGTVKATGKKLSIPLTSVWRVNSAGQVTSVTNYYDSAPMAKAFGKA